MKNNEQNLNLVFDINSQLKQEIEKNKVLRIGFYSISVIGGILAIGYIAKVLNFTASHIKGLTNTLKTN